MRSIYEEIFYQENVSQEEKLSDIETGEEIIIDNIITRCEKTL